MRVGIFIIGWLLAFLPQVGRADVVAESTDLSSDALRAFADDFVADTMSRFHAPGAACAIVKDGRVIYVKGYGVSDLEHQTPLDPADTRFSIGSISKLFTATAAMQLVERGKIKLDADITPLLGQEVQIKNPFDAPITLRRLLTHTAGFDQRYLGVAVYHRSQVPSLEQLLTDVRPTCRMRPGVDLSYSEMSYTLAGYLVERESKMRFAEFVKLNVLQPLGMKNSGFENDLESVRHRVRGYEWNDARHELMPTLFVRTTPCAGMNATVADLAQFMIAHLGNGQVNDFRILKPETARMMHERQFAYDENWDAIALGFYSRRLNGERILVHGGASLGTTGNLFLLPDRNVGCVFMFNVFNYGILELPPEAFAQHFFKNRPPRQPASPPAVLSAMTLRTMSGQYRHVSYSRDTIEKLQYLRAQVFVHLQDDGTVVATADPYTDTPGTFVQWEGDRFRQINSDHPQELKFRTDATGRVTHLLMNCESYEKLSWFEHPKLHRLMFQQCAVLFFWAGVLWPIGRVIARWWTGAASKSASADRILSAACVIYLFFLIGFGVLFSITPENRLIFGPTRGMRILLWFPIVAGLLTLLGSYRTIRTFSLHESLFRRLHRIAITAVLIGFNPLLMYWNLIGFNY